MVLKIIWIFKNKIQKGLNRASDKDSLCYCCRSERQKTHNPTLVFISCTSQKSKTISLGITVAGLYKTPNTHLLSCHKNVGSLPKNLPASSWGRKLCKTSSVILGLSEGFLLLALKHFLCLHPRENNHRKDLTQCWSGLRGFCTGFAALMFSVVNHKPTLDLTGEMLIMDKQKINQIFIIWLNIINHL